MPDPDDGDTLLLTLPDQDGRNVEIRRFDVLQVFGKAGRPGPRDWVDFLTITTEAGAASAARQVLTARHLFGNPWRIVRGPRVILK